MAGGSQWNPSHGAPPLGAPSNQTDDAPLRRTDYLLLLPAAGRIVALGIVP